MSNLTSITTAIPTTPMASIGAAWRDRHDCTGLEHVVTAHPSLHNSMQPMGAVPANSFDAGRRVYAAKQAAPPRGPLR